MMWICLATAAAPIPAEVPKSQTPQAQDLILIHPKDRATDFKEAFDFLKQQKASARARFLLKDGKMLTNILDITVPQGGTLLIFQINTSQGYNYQVVKVEDIESIAYQ